MEQSEVRVNPIARLESLGPADYPGGNTFETEFGASETDRSDDDDDEEAFFGEMFGFSGGADGTPTELSFLDNEPARGDTAPQYPWEG